MEGLQILTERTAQLSPGTLTLLLAITAWTLAWKGVALWKSARLSQKTWFVVLLLVNTVGILEIIYIFAVARRKEKTIPHGTGAHETHEGGTAHEHSREQ